METQSPPRLRKVPKKGPKEAVTQAQFDEFLAGVRLTDIWINSCDAAIKDRALLLKPGKRELDLGFAAKLIKATESRATVSVLFITKILLGSESDEEADGGLFAVSFHVEYETSRKMTPAIFEIFKDPSVRIQVAPFAREWIHEQSLRMGIPPVLIPLKICQPAPSRGPEPKRLSSGKVSKVQRPSGKRAVSQ